METGVAPNRATPSLTLKMTIECCERKFAVTADKTKMKVGTGDWIVVCDGRKAFILENAGDKVFPNLKTKQVFEHADLSTRALGADAPGRTHQSMARGGSAVEQTDWHDEAERAFLVSLANRLDTAVTTG